MTGQNCPKITIIYIDEIEKKERYENIVGQQKSQKTSQSFLFLMHFVAMVG